MESGNHYGPALPPGMVVTSKTKKSAAKSSSSKQGRVIGPTLPPGMQKSSDSDDLSDEGQLTVKMDSEMSPEYVQENDEEDDDEDDGDNQGGNIGPMPSEMNQDGEDVVQAAEEFERRSKRMKAKLTIKAEAEEGPVKREEWMTELPPEMGKNFGLQSRTFSKGGGSEDNKDRSGWTETAASKKEKDSGKSKKRKREDEKVVLVRDEQMQQQVDEYNKSKRPESLMDMHSKKLKKKKKKEKKEKKKRKGKEKREERRPFDREKDLHVNKFDDAQKQAIIKRSQLLNTRFTHSGTTSHFL